MGVLPRPVEELLETALVSELTVVDASGLPVTYPLIPLYDGEVIFIDLEHPLLEEARAHQGEPEGLDLDQRPHRVDVDPFRRATIQGDATVDDADLHCGPGARAPALA